MFRALQSWARPVESPYVVEWNVKVAVSPNTQTRNIHNKNDKIKKAIFQGTFINKYTHERCN